MSVRSGGQSPKTVPSRANYGACALALIFGAFIFLGADNLNSETRRGFPLWLLGAAFLVIGVGGGLWTAYKRRRS